MLHRLYPQQVLVLGLCLCLATLFSCSSDDIAANQAVSTTSSAGAAPHQGGGGTGGSHNNAPLTSVSFPQAVGGVMQVSTSVYEQIPLQLLVEGSADSVTVTIADSTLNASDSDGDGLWTATIATASLSAGTVTLEASASKQSDEVTATATLEVSAEGVRLSDFDVDGAVGTPRLHRADDALWMTWTDHSGASAEAWMQKLDGAGRTNGDRIRLVNASGDTVYARVALGSSRVGILYQNAPHLNFFKMVDMNGGEQLAPIALDPADMLGCDGGQVVYDGHGFVFVWRIRDDNDNSEIRWARVKEDNGELTGPVTVASAGPATVSEPNGTFKPFTVLDVATIGERSIVTYTQEIYDAIFDTTEKTRISTVSLDGVVLSAEVTTLPAASLDWEARSFRLNESVVALWASTDFYDESSSTSFFAAASNQQGEINAASGSMVLSAIGDRNGAHLIGHPQHHGVLAWLDHRKHSEDPINGRIELYLAPVGSNLAVVQPPHIIEHGVMTSAVSELGAVNAGSNILLIWRDARNHGFFKHELWLETAWF